MDTLARALDKSAFPARHGRAFSTPRPPSLGAKKTGRASHAGLTGICVDGFAVHFMVRTATPGRDRVATGLTRPTLAVILPRMIGGADYLLRTIARCPVVEQCKAMGPRAAHPCGAIVGVQDRVSLADHQVPEPWSGDILRARVLFVSSNPSISLTAQFPMWSWPDEWITDYFANRFGGGRKQWILDGKRPLQSDGTYAATPSAFWAKVRARAAEILGSDARPGTDYALTEVVRCKSKREVGVAQAINECTGRYLRPTLDVAAAPLIVTLGEKSRLAVAARFGGPERQSAFGPVVIGGRQRVIVALGHPSSGQPQSFAACLGPATVRQLKAFVLEASP